MLLLLWFSFSFGGSFLNGWSFSDSSPVAELSNAHGMMGIGRQWDTSGHSYDPLRYAHLFQLGTVAESAVRIKNQNAVFILHISRLIRVLPSHPRFTLISVFYPHIRVLPSRPSVRLSVRPFIRPSVHSSVSAFYPYPLVTLQNDVTNLLFKLQNLTNKLSQFTLNWKSQYD